MRAIAESCSAPTRDEAVIEYPKILYFSTVYDGRLVGHGMTWPFNGLAWHSSFSVRRGRQSVTIGQTRGVADSWRNSAGFAPAAPVRTVNDVRRVHYHPYPALN
jgi:hypothetical protein